MTRSLYAPNCPCGYGLRSAPRAARLQAVRDAAAQGRPVDLELIRQIEEEGR